MSEFAPQILERAGISTDIYVLTEVFGESRHSLTAAATEWQTGQDVFIKAKDATCLNSGNKLAKEAELLSELGSHDQIPTLLAARVGDGVETPYIITEYKAANQDPIEFLKEHSSMRIAARFCLEATMPLAFVHEKDITHRDVKPENFLWQWPDKVWLTDFELGIRAEDEYDHAVRVSGRPVAAPNEATGEEPQVNPEKPKEPEEPVYITYTAKYVAPERALGRRGNARADVYSMGIVMHELVIGKPPFEGTDLEVAQKHANVTPIDLSDTNGRRVPDQLLEVIEQSTQKRPSRRYANAAEMAAAILPFVYDNSHRHERAELAIAA